MLETEDIRKLTEYQLKAFKDAFFAQKVGQKLQSEVLVLKENVSEIKSTMRSLETKIDKVQNTLDSVVKDNKVKNQEVVILNYRMGKAENWIHKASPKLGLKYEH